MISSRSRYVREYRRYQRTHKRIITSSKCRPRNSAGRFRVTIHRTRSVHPVCNRSIHGTRLVWKVPSHSLVRDILCNPFYAGAYVWGRRPITTLLVEGRLEKRQSAMRRAEECRVFIRDHHVGYIDWATYEENQRMIRRNSVNWQGDERFGDKTIHENRPFFPRSQPDVNAGRKTCKILM